MRVLRPAAVACTDLRRGRDLDGCSLSVPAGARLLVVSEPETSASVLLRVLAGLVPARRGHIRIAGTDDPSPRGWGRRLAYLGPNPGLHTWMTPFEALSLAADLLDLPRVGLRERIERAGAWAGIASAAMERPMRRGGIPLEQRTGLAAAMLGDPEVVLFDDPLRALEQHERTQLLRLPGRRRTILLASRYPASEAGIASFVVLLRAGRIALIATTVELERVGLPLSHAGISALAAMRSRDSQAAGVTPPA